MHKLIRILLQADSDEEATERVKELLTNIVGQGKKYDWYTLKSGWELSGKTIKVTDDTKEKLKTAKITDFSRDTVETEEVGAYELICGGLHATFDDICIHLKEIKTGLEKYSIEEYAQSADWDYKKIPVAESLSFVRVDDSDWVYIEDGDSLYKLDGLPSLIAFIDTFNYVIPVDVHS